MEHTHVHRIKFHSSVLVCQVNFRFLIDQTRGLEAQLRASQNYEHRPGFRINRHLLSKNVVFRPSPSP